LIVYGSASARMSVTGRRGSQALAEVEVHEHLLHAAPRTDDARIALAGQAWIAQAHLLGHLAQ
jgi:hypothetical protein